MIPINKSTLSRRGPLKPAQAVMDVDALAAYHDRLLFVLAYPENAAARRIAARALGRVAKTARAMTTNGPERVRAKLRGSGIAWSSTTIAFSCAIARWLVARYPRCVEIDSLGERADLLVEWLRHALPPLEFELVGSGEEAPASLIDPSVTGRTTSPLAWLLAQFERLPCSADLRETLFDTLQLFLTLNPRDALISRTFARGLSAATHYHRVPLQRGVGAIEPLIAKRLPPERALSSRERLQLIDAARGILAVMGRETDPITYADARYVRHHALGRGLAIALYSARPARRNPLDSHIGYVLFKNAVPIAYGGGWPFLGTCRIGINIFAAFRGGESGMAMVSILRTYAQLFAVERFLVEPYQFGAGNREGLQSGAFWFYYRLGFRPLDRKVREVASSEFERMRRTSGYRSPLAVLRRLTRSDLELVVVPGAAPGCDPADLSHATTRWIAARFGGDRNRAERFSMRRVSAAISLDPSAWSDAEKAALRAIAPLLAQIDDLGDWPLRDKARLKALVRAKSGDEFRHFALMAGFTRLRKSFDEIAARAGS